MKFKLLERRAKARQTLGKLEEGVADVDEAVAALEKANLAQEKRDGKKAELQRFGVESSSRESCTSQVEKRTLHRLGRGRQFKREQSKTIRAPPARREPQISNLQ